MLVGDGSYLMMSQEIVTAIQEDAKLIVILVDNSGYRSIGSLSQSLGGGGFGTEFRFRGATGEFDGAVLPVDLMMNAASLGAVVLRANNLSELRLSLEEARRQLRTVVIVASTDPKIMSPSYGWWDVPVAELSSSEAVRLARREYELEALPPRPYI